MGYVFLSIDKINFYNVRNKNKRYALKAFLIGIAVSFCFFIPFIIYDNGYFLYYGDFNVQQVPFYQMIHDAIRSGNIFWSFTTDLGANTIGSYSFYLLGSPFFWLTLPFPSEAVPYLMGPLLILKFGCATLTGYIFLKRYVINRDYAVIGGMIYAFSGFSVYNIFFNHFHEAIVFFPLLLAALDEYMDSKRKGLVTLAVFICCLSNYYFFVGQVVFCIIYFTLRLCFKSYKITIKEFAWLFFETILGVGLTAFLLVPTILAVTQNPRVSSNLTGWNILAFTNRTQRYIHIIECFFFPPDIPARPNFTPDSDSKWASLGAWLPLFSISGVMAWITHKKKHWLSILLIILFIMTLVPILNSAFQLFNAAYYARWFYIITLMMSLATIMSLENSKVDWNSSIWMTLSATLIIALPIGLMPKKIMVGETETIGIGVEAYKDRFWIYVAIATVSLLLFLFILTYKKNKALFVKCAMLGVAVISIFYSTYIIFLGKSQSYDTHNFIIPYCLNGGKDINLPNEDQFSRIDTYETMDNAPMFWKKPTIQAFHSIVPGSVMDFYPSIGVTRDVGSRPKTSVYGLRALTSCKWLFDYADDNEYFAGEDKNKPSMPGYKYYGKQNGFDIWENSCFIPMGFFYDDYITHSQYNSIPEDKRHLALLKAIVLNEDGENRNNDILNHVTNVNKFVYSEKEYFKDCKTLKQNTCSSFEYDNLGFTAEINVPAGKDRLVFFSIPYEKGWSATVNGQDSVIEKTNIGFMAVRVPQGSESTIRFNFKTPGLDYGIIISIACVAIFIVYIFLVKEKYKKRKKIYRIKKDLH
jgi:uncharacterized membrane protein YfhO